MLCACQHLLHAEADTRSETISELLLGEGLEVLETHGEWARVACDHDGYKGWLPARCVADGVGGEFTRITALRGHVYAHPSVQANRIARLSLGSRVVLGGARDDDDGRVWFETSWPAGGWIQAALLRPLPPLPQLGLEFVGTPYVWGGRSAWGIDCSGLMQVLHGAHGVALPRDSGPQYAALSPVASASAGALAFFHGHVGLMLDVTQMLNATSYHMQVTVDTLFESGTWSQNDYSARLQRDFIGFAKLSL